MRARFANAKVRGTMSGVDILRDAPALYRRAKAGDTITVEDAAGFPVLTLSPAEGGMVGVLVDVHAGASAAGVSPVDIFDAFLAVHNPTGHVPLDTGN